MSNSIGHKIFGLRLLIDHSSIIANNQWLINWLLIDYSLITNWCHWSSISYVWYKLWCTWARHAGTFSPLCLNVMFTLIKIFLKVNCPSVNEVKAGVKAEKKLQKWTYNSGGFSFDLLSQPLIPSWRDKRDALQDIILFFQRSLDLVMFLSERAWKLKPFTPVTEVVGFIWLMIVHHQFTPWHGSLF